MTSAMKQEQENHDTHNIVPLGSDEIKSILKSQSETVFKDKNISTNSNFVKKSLIDIALDFEAKQNITENKVINDTSENDKKLNEENKVINDTSENDKKLNEENDVISDQQKTEELIPDENNDSDNKIDMPVEVEQSNNKVDINSIGDGNLDEIEKDVQSEKLIQDGSFTDIESDNPKQQDENIADKKSDETVKADDETQQALDSVRDAVSQSMNKNDDETIKNSEEIKKLNDSVSDKFNKDLEDFKNILSSLPSLAEEAIYEVFQNKILEISYELAGYQIDKMPEKYEKKIKSFIKNINCYQDKITIEVNDKDFEALSKIKKFNINEDKKIFISNKELSRGDIILNCDGMRYSEKSNYCT